jgi:hypothetical protein
VADQEVTIISSKIMCQDTNLGNRLLSHLDVTVAVSNTSVLSTVVAMIKNRFSFWVVCFDWFTAYVATFPTKKIILEFYPICPGRFLRKSEQILSNPIALFQKSIPRLFHNVLPKQSGIL